MRLVSCYIENFGKLKDFSLEFDEGCNVICQDNGWGKSTLAAFIKVMLYGFEEEKSRDELKNERKRYKPWQGGVYGGRLEFESEGRHYVITRTFGTKEKEDSFSLRRKDTNLECRDYSSAVGEELFSLDCNSFCRTVFVSQSDCETASTDAINAKIGNLAEDTDDINNYESVNQRFLNLLNQMSPTRKTGSLYRLKDEISSLEDHVRAGRSVDQSIEEICKRLHEKLVEQQGLKEEQAQLIKKQQEIGAYKDIQVKQEKYKGLCEEFEERKSRVEGERAYFPGRIPETRELEDIFAKSAGLSAARESVHIYSLTEEEKQRKERLQKLFAAGCPDQESLREQEEKLQTLQEIRVSLAENQISGDEAERLQNYRRQFAQGVPKLQDFEKVIADWSSHVERKNVLSQKKLTYEALSGIAQVNLGGEKQRSSAAAGALIFVGAALILAGILIGIAGTQVIPGIFTGIFGLLVLGAGVFGVKRGGAFGQKTGAGQRAEHNGENDSLERMSREIAEDEEFIERVGLETRNFLENYGIECDREGEILDRLYRFKSEVREYITLSERDHAGRQEDLLIRHRELTESVRSFLADFYPSEQMEETKFTAMLAKLKELSSEYMALKKKSDHLQGAQNDYGQLLTLLQEFVGGLSLTVREDIQDQLLQIKSHLQSLDISMQEYGNIKQRKEAFETDENLNEILRSKPAQEMEDLQDINSRLEEIAGRLEKLYEYVANYNRQLDELRDESDSVAEAAQRLAELKAEYRDNLQKYELLKVTRKMLEQAKISFTARYTEPIRKSIGKYYELLSGEGAERIFVDANTQVTVDEQGMQREPRFFSAGCRDLIGICMRMALVDAMYHEEKPFVIFDDPFANLDGNKLEGAMALLQQIGREYQVLYFTCHESRAV